MIRSRYALLALLLLASFHAHAVQVSLNIQPARCGLNSGRVTASAYGGLPPYTYTWSNGSSSAQISGIAPGSYTVTVMDGQGESVQATAEVLSLWELNPAGAYPGRPDCDDMCSGSATASIGLLGGTAPYTSNHPLFYEVMGSPEYLVAGLCAYQPTTFTITDANGCSGTYTVEVIGNSMWYQSGFEALPACGGASNGTIIVPGNLLGAGAMVQLQPFGGVPPMEHIVLDDLDYHWEGLAPGNYYVSVLYQTGDFGEYQMPYCSSGSSVTVGDLPGPCGTLSGTVFYDVDQDCTQDAGDMGLPYRVLTIQPGDIHAFTSATGTFALNLSFGSFTLAQPLFDEQQICPQAHPVPFTIDALAPDAVIDLADLSNVPHDVFIHLAGTALRPGFPFNAYATITNNTAFPSGALTVTMDLDPVLGAVNPTPAAAVNNNSHVQWDLPALQPYSSTQVRVFGTVPPDVGLLGSERTFLATVVNGASETNTTNNTTSRTVTVTGSYDPNDKQGFTSSNGSPTYYFLDNDTHIDYTVRFQNTGTDTAFTVVIRDAIDIDLDLNSIEFLGASHAFVPSFGEGREMVLTFPNILLPDSTTDLAGSQGFVSYRITPRSGIQLGDVFTNTAAIYFDFNDPIITNTTEYVVGTSTAMAELRGQRMHPWPVPAHDVLNVPLPDGADRSFSVWTMDGRMLTVAGRNNGTALQLDVRSLAPGIYLLGTATGTTRFVKQ